MCLGTLLSQLGGTKVNQVCHPVQMNTLLQLSYIQNLNT